MHRFATDCSGPAGARGAEFVARELQYLGGSRELQTFTCSVKVGAVCWSLALERCERQQRIHMSRLVELMVLNDYVTETEVTDQGRHLIATAFAGVR